MAEASTSMLAIMMSWIRTWYAALLALATFLVLIPVARLDFDRHHDGYMLAQAMAVHEGAAIHRDAFAQYGPVTPWLQSLALYLPTGPGLALRLFTALVIAATVFMMADLGRATPSSWPIRRWPALLAAFSWVVLADFWLGIPMLPWASVLAAAFGVAVLYCFGTSARQAQLGKPTSTKIAAFSGGLVAGIIPFTRLNAGIMVIALLIVIGAGVALRGRALTRQIPAWGLAGAALSFSGVVVALILTGSLRFFWQQSVLWPLRWSSGPGYGRDAVSVIVQDFIAQLLPISLCLSALTLFAILRTRHAFKRYQTLAAAYSLVVGLVIAVILTRQGLASHVDIPGSQPSGPLALWEVITTPNVSYLTFFLFLAVILALLVAFAIVIAWVRHRTFPAAGTSWLLLVGLTVVGCSQIYPVPESRHEWWGLPVGLLLIFSVVHRFVPPKRPIQNPLLIPIAFVTLMAIGSGWAYLGNPRVAGTAGTITEGMLVDRASQDSIDSDVRLIRDALPGQGSAIFVAGNGDASVLTGTYRSLDAFFVSWGNVPQIEDRLGTRPPIVRELPAEGPDDFALQINYYVAASNGTYAVLLPREE
jgi:hypothetical protein